jgi:alkane 1-monooxygenase
MKALPFCIIYLLPLAVVTGYLLGGAYHFLTPLFVFGLIPLLDLVVGVNTKNPGEEDEQALADHRIYRYVTWACMPLQVAMVVWGAFVVTHRYLSPLELTGFILAVGISSGAMGINVSHELIHRVNNRLEPFLGRVMLATVCYLHWAIEHVKGHHRCVATPLDPATARRGESFYAFWPRTVKGGFLSAWGMEKERLARQGRKGWSIHNAVVWYVAAEFLVVTTIGWAFGFWAVLFFLAQSVVAVSLLEAVNYLEHYGMERMKLEDGTYEKVRPVHSWNASHRITNHFLFNLQRHSDHHYRPNRRYQILRHFDESPQLPTGYAGMVLLTLVTPAWRRVMDGRLPGLQTPPSPAPSLKRL